MLSDYHLTNTIMNYGYEYDAYPVCGCGYVLSLHVHEYDYAHLQTVDHEDVYDAYHHVDVYVHELLTHEDVNVDEARKLPDNFRLA